MFDEILAHIVFLENVRASIRPEIQAIEQAGFVPKVYSAPLSLANHLSNPNHPPIAAIVLDMHIPDIKDLGSVGHSKKRTLDGRVVGLAFAEAWLRTAGSPYRDIPIVFLTGRPVPPEAVPRIKQLSNGNKEVQLFRKKQDLPKFEQFLDSLKLSADAHDGGHEWEHYGDWIRVAGRVAEGLFEDPRDIATIFGFGPKPNTPQPSVAEALEIMQRYPQWDFLERASLVVDLKAQLDAIYGSDLAAQRKWLNRPLDVRGGRSPRQLLCRTGHRFALLDVAGLLHRVNG